MTQVLGLSLDSHDIYEVGQTLSGTHTWWGLHPQRWLTLGRVQGFLKSWGLILCSEIGDKTFFIAAILAMKHSRLVVRPLTPAYSWL